MSAKITVASVSAELNASRAETALVTEKLAAAETRIIELEAQLAEFTKTAVDKFCDAMQITRTKDIWQHVEGTCKNGTFRLWMNVEFYKANREASTTFIKKLESHSISKGATTQKHADHLAVTPKVS